MICFNLIFSICFILIISFHPITTFHIKYVFISRIVNRFFSDNERIKFYIFSIEKNKSITN